MDSLDERGMTALHQPELLRVIHKLIPDSAELDDVQRNSMPPLIRNFRCGKGVEEGEPYCGREKFSMQICEDRRFRTSWHPGW